MGFRFDQNHIGGQVAAGVPPRRSRKSKQEA
jgi:hypothetical protein